jgi:uncharacterized membrane protein YqjE
VTVTPGPTATPGPAASEPSGTPAAKHAVEPSLGQLVDESIGSLQQIVRSEIELAKLELTSSVKNAGVGIGFFIAAAVVIVFSLTFLFIAIAEVLARYLMPRWAAFLAVFGLLILVAGISVWIGVRKVKRVRAPARTIATSKDTVADLKKNVRPSTKKA